MNLSFSGFERNDEFICHIKKIIEIYINQKEDNERLQFEKGQIENELVELKCKMLKSENCTDQNFITPINKRRRKTGSQDKQSDTSSNISPSSDAFNNAIRDYLIVDDETIGETPNASNRDISLTSPRKSPLKCSQEIVIKKEKQNSKGGNNESKAINEDPKRESISVLKPRPPTKSKENYQQIATCSKWQSKEQLKSKTTPSKRFLDNWCSSNISFVQPPSPSPKKPVNSPRRLSLASRKNKNDSMSSSTETSDYDETFCDGIIVPSQQEPEKKSTIKCKSLRQKTLTSFHQLKPKRDDALFNFSRAKNDSMNDFFNQNKHVKVEKLTPAKIEKKLPIVNPYISPSMSTDSVFAVPNDTDEIIFLSESPSSTPDLLNSITGAEPASFLKENSRKDNFKGFECPECAAYYKWLGDDLTNTQIQNRINQCSRHKKPQNFNATPDGFWIPYFVPTQNKQETEIDYRFVQRKDNN